MSSILDGLKNLGNLQGILEQAQKMRSEYDRIQEELEKREVEATAGGGMVTVKANGAMMISGVKIDRTVVDPADIDMLQDLVRAATNEALRKAKDMAKEEMSKLTGGISIPGFSA